MSFSNRVCIFFLVFDVVGILTITPSEWRLANGCIPTFYIHQSPPPHTPAISKAIGNKKKKKNNRRKVKTTEDKLREAEVGMLRCLKEIERLESPTYTESQAVKLDDMVKKEIENMEIKPLGDMVWKDYSYMTEDEIELRISELPEELKSIARESPEGLIKRKDEIKEILLEKARRIRKLEEEDNERNARCFKLMQERLSLFTAVTKSSLENQRLDQVCENLQELCRLTSQRTKLTVQNHEEKAAATEGNIEELVNRFKDTISEIKIKIQNQKEAKEAQDKENDEFEAKIKEFKEHAKLRREHYDNQLKAKKLEAQLEEAKLAQQEKILEQLKAKSEALRNHINQSKQNEKDMKAQIKLYEDKFEQFQEALSKSDEMFVDFNERLQSMEKSNEALRQEHAKYAEETAKLDVRLIKAFDEKQRLTEELEAKLNMKAAIGKECRALQAEIAGNAAAQAASTVSADHDH